MNKVAEGQKADQKQFYKFLFIGWSPTLALLIGLIGGPNMGAAFLWITFFVGLFWTLIFVIQQNDKTVQVLVGYFSGSCLCAASIFLMIHYLVASLHGVTFTPVL